MGPWSEERQLQRRNSVLKLLQRDDLSEWARGYWGLVYDTIARDEARYNARVVALYSTLKRKEMVDYGS